MSDSEKQLGDPAEAVVRRAGDSGLGVPEFEPKKSRVLTEKERNNHQAEVEEMLRLKAESMLFELEQEEGWTLPTPVRQFCSAVLVAVAAVLGLFLVIETVQFFATMESLPMWGQWVATGCLVVFGGIIAAILLKLIWGVIRLQRSPRIHLQAMKTLAERRSLQCVAAEKQSEARDLLKKYVKEYPVTGKDRKRMRAGGMTEQEWSTLLMAKKRLLDSSRPLTHVEWIEDFQKEFQRVLDHVAGRRIKQYALRVGAGTAASPIAMVDRMIVFYGCTAMVKDLFVLYHLRPALGQTVVILSRAVVQTYLSGIIEEAAETAVDAGADSLSEYIGEGAGVLTGTLGRAVGAKATEAALNGYLLYRLGKRAKAQLQPIRT